MTDSGRSRCRGRRGAFGSFGLISNGNGIGHSCGAWTRTVRVVVMLTTEGRASSIVLTKRSVNGRAWARSCSTSFASAWRSFSDGAEAVSAPQQPGPDAASSNAPRTAANLVLFIRGISFSM